MTGETMQVLVRRAINDPGAIVGPRQVSNWSARAVMRLFEDPSARVASPVLFDREHLARIVRAAWVRVVRALVDNPKETWTASYDETDDFQREADAQIGEAVAAYVLDELAVTPTSDAHTVLTHLCVCNVPDGTPRIVYADGCLELPDGVTRECPVHGEPLAIIDELLDAADARPSAEQLLRAMHTALNIHAGWLPGKPTTDLPPGLPELRWALIDEEVNRELRPAIEAGDVVAIADACADAVVTIIGTAISYGIPFDAVLAEVHRSNMTKTNPAGQKLAKGPGYSPPDIAGVLAAGVEAQ